MPIIRLSPDAIAASTNLTGAVGDIDEDPSSPDASWLTATSATAATDLRVTFPTPAAPPLAAQSFPLWLRKTAGTPNPTVNVSLYQGGTLRAALLSGTSITSTTGQLVTANWNVSDLVTVLDGSDVECRVEGVPGTSAVAGALPAYAGAGTVFTSNTMPQTNLALNSPTHAAGDLLIALVCCRNTNNDGTLTSVNGTGGTTGWTLENNSGSMYGGTQNARIGFGWKVAESASEICSITTTGGTSTDRISARVYRFTAGNGFATPAVANVAAGTTGTLSAGQDMTMPTVASGGATNGLAVCLYGISTSSTQAAPTGATGGTWTEPVAEDAGTNATTGIFIADDSDAGGLSGGTSASGATSDVWVNVSLRLNPAAGTANINIVEVGAVGWDEQYLILPERGTGGAVGAGAAVGLGIGPAGGVGQASGNAPELTLDLPSAINTVEVGAAAWLLQGIAVLTPSTGIAAPTGNTPSISLQLAIASGLAAAAGNVPASAMEHAGQEGTVSGTGNTPDLQQTLAVASGAVQGVGGTPSTQVGFGVDPQSGQASASGGESKLSLAVAPQQGTADAVGLTSPDLSLALLGSAGASQSVGSEPALQLALTPSSGAATTVGETPTRSLALQLPDSAATASGSAPSIRQGPPLINTIEIGAATWLFQGASARIPSTGIGLASGGSSSLSLLHTPQPGLAAASGNTLTTATQQTPTTGLTAASGDTPSLEHYLLAQNGAVSAAGSAPSLTVQSGLSPLTGVAAASGSTPTSSFVIGAATGAVSAQGNAPIQSLTLQAAAGSAQAAGNTPALVVQTANSPITGLAEASGASPPITRGLLVQAGAASAAGEPPAISHSLPVQSGTATAQGAAPAVSIQLASTPTTGLAAASGNTPTTSLALTPQLGQGTGQGAFPTKSTTLQANAGTTSAIGTAPTIFLQTANSPVTGNIVATGNTPALPRTFILTPTRGTAAATGQASALSKQLAVSQGTTLASGNQPTVFLQAENTPLVGLAAASGNTPSLSRELAPARGTAAASGTPPHVSTGLDLTPLAGSAQTSGNLPLRQLAFGPIPTAALASGNAPTLTQALAPTNGIILGSGPAPSHTSILTPIATVVSAAGNEPERFVGRFIFPEAGEASASTAEACTRALILELFGTTAVRTLGGVGEVLLALPGNRRETALTRLYSRLLLLSPSGILIARNSTIPLAIPPAGAVVMLDSGPDITDRGLTEDSFNHRVRLELFILRTNPLAKTIQDLEDEVAAILAADRTLGGVLDQMFLFPTSSLVITGGGTPIDINALSISLTYGEPHAQL